MADNIKVVKVVPTRWKAKKMAKISGVELVGTVSINGHGEYAVIVCPGCGLPRLADYSCYSCEKNELLEENKELKKRVNFLLAFVKRVINILKDGGFLPD